MNWFGWLFGKRPANDNQSDLDTEFMCEVVRITSVDPHPNADRLEIIGFESKRGQTGYRVVDRKGARKVGDLVTYLSVDCVVPLVHPHFEFLKNPGSTKTHHRLRAARLRGVYSEGLIVDPPGVAPIGHSPAESWGVTYHRSPADEPRERTQPQKRTWWSRWKRADWRQNLIPVYGVASLRKDPYIFKEGEQVIVTEKIHGTNFRFGFIRGQFVVGSHRTFRTDNRSWLAKKLNVGRKPGPGFYGEDVYVAAASRHNLEAACRKFPGVMFYGELFGLTQSGKEIQKGFAYTREELGVRIFDAYDTKARTWLPASEIGAVARELGLEAVPILAWGAYETGWAKQLAEGQTLLESMGEPAPVTQRRDYFRPPVPRVDHIREGVVIESVDGPRRKAKLVSEAYRLMQAGNDA